MIKILKLILEIKVICVLAILFLAPSFSIAERVLVWDKNDEADFYILYWGSSPGEYSETLRLNVTDDIIEVPLAEAEDGDVCYFSVKAFNVCGTSSEFSEEVSSTYIPGKEFVLEVLSTQTQETDFLPEMSGEGRGMLENSNGGCFINSAIK